MPRISEVRSDSATAEQAQILDADIERYGDVLNTTRIYAHAPQLVPPLRALHSALAEGALSDGLVSLVRLRVAQINECPF